MRQLAKKSWQFGTPIAPAKIWQKLTVILKSRVSAGISPTPAA
jgi:hypothetical protein